MLPAKILILSDQPTYAQTWEPSLSQRGHQVNVIASNHIPAGDSLSQQDIVILDSYTADFDLVALCQAVRQHFHQVMLALTHERDERLHLLLYQAGVDEAIVKPLSVPLFWAKVAVWLQRGAQVVQPSTQVTTANFRLEPNRKWLITAEGKKMRLSTLECSLLALLMRNQGRILESDLIIDRVWPSDTLGDRELLKNLIYRLRRKIEPDPTAPRHIQTVNGQGYVFYAC